MKKVILFYILPLIIILSGIWLAIAGIHQYRANADERKIAAAEKEEKEAQEKAVDDLLASRRAEVENSEDNDIFGDDGIVKILLIGLDSRAGDTSGHCDAIQLVKIDKNKKTVSIIAVPRGTYSPLPPGVGKLPSDYYVSNACGLVGLDYGIEQIERILGEKEDYLVVVGFSEVLGILRDLKLPTMDTLRWLRHRQGYAIGEPQRAHNHSTFLKQLIVRFTPQQNYFLNKILQRIIYNLVKTDISFAQTQNILEVLSEMELDENQDKIILGMRPSFGVVDIPYSPENVSEYLDRMITPIKDRLNDKDYSGKDGLTAEGDLLKIIGDNIEDSTFVDWGFNNAIWLQIDDDSKRLSVQYDFLSRYVSKSTSSLECQNVISDYILEMEYYKEDSWAEKGKELLKSFISEL